MFSGYCCSASLVIVFLQDQPVGQGARLCCGKELWGDGETECIISQQRFAGCCMQAVQLFLCAPCRLNYSTRDWKELSICYLGFDFAFQCWNASIALAAAGWHANWASSSLLRPSFLAQFQLAWFQFVFQSIAWCWGWSYVCLTISAVNWCCDVSLPSQTLSSLLWYREQLMHSNCVRHWVLSCDPMLKVPS